MMLRVIASLFALVTVVAAVFCESYLANAGYLSVRDDLYDWFLNAGPGGGAVAVWDAACLAMVYTLPECLAVIGLYHVYAAFAKSTGFGDGAPDPRDPYR
ncbi:MAG: hypothetical protein ACPGYV_07490 [Phycisphaeraceae bacterium]